MYTHQGSNLLAVFQSVIKKMTKLKGLHKLSISIMILCSVVEDTCRKNFEISSACIWPVEFKHVTSKVCMIGGMECYKLKIEITVSWIDWLKMNIQSTKSPCFLFTSFWGCEFVHLRSLNLKIKQFNVSSFLVVLKLKLVHHGNYPS